jgi:hypothetical protein
MAHENLFKSLLKQKYDLLEALDNFGKRLKNSFSYKLRNGAIWHATESEVGS